MQQKNSIEHLFQKIKCCSKTVVLEKLKCCSKETLLQQAASCSKERLLHNLKFCNIALTALTVVLVGTVSATSALGGHYNFGNAYTIALNGEPTVFFSQKEQAKEALNHYLTDKGYDFGNDVYLTGRIEIQKADCDNNIVYTDPWVGAKALDQSLTPVVVASAVTVDQTPQAWLATPEEAEEVLHQVRASYLPKADQVAVLSSEFRQQVDILPTITPLNQVMDTAQATGTLLSPLVTTDHYRVKQGDSLAAIAAAHKTTTDALYLYNPALVSATELTQVPDLTIACSKPLLNVVSRVKITDYTDIPFETTYTSDRQAAVGTQTVAQPGQPGTEKVISEVYLENGKTIEFTPLATAVVTAPVNQVVALGGAFSMASRDGMLVDYNYTGGSGIVQWPVQGTLTSYYGGRGSGFHTGLDIATDSGTPIAAAAAGIVTFSGWGGGYGNIVKLNNGNGMETWYAHMNETAAVVGQYVDAGDCIGYLGSTGNSTGPHCHFEVRFNGETANPLDYLP